MITTNDIQGIISIAILNNESGVVDAMNESGYKASKNIATADLAAKLWTVFSEKGVGGLENVLNKVRVTDKITEEQAKALVTRFKGVDKDAKFGDWIKGVGDFFGGLLGGSSVTGGTVTQMSSESALSPALLALVVVVGVIMIAIFRKTVAVVVAVMVIVLAVVLYGIFAKKITTTSTGGTTTSQGGIGDVVLGFLSGLFGKKA